MQFRLEFEGKVYNEYKMKQEKDLDLDEAFFGIGANISASFLFSRSILRTDSLCLIRNTSCVSAIGIAANGKC
jgi:hypothetical protein